MEKVRLALIAAWLCSSLLWASSALAQSAPWPWKPVRWIVPFPPGGAADAVARLVAQKLAEQIAQPSVVENRPGAGGNIAHDAVANASPDGHTLLFAVAGIVTNPHTIAGSPDPFSQLSAVILLARGPLVLLAGRKFSALPLPQALAHIRANPGSVNCGAAGALPTVGCLLLQRHTAEMVMVPYKGNAPALSALAGGEIDLLFEVVSVALPHLKGERVRALAATAGRIEGLPALSDAVPDAELVAWQGAMVPRATPAEVVARVNRALQGALDTPELKEKLAAAGLEAGGGSSADFERLMRRDYERYGRILREAGVKPQ